MPDVGKIMIYAAVKKLIRLAAFALAVLFFGCGGQVSETRSAANVSQNQTVQANVSDEKVVPVEKFERDGKLQTDADALLPLFDKMPPVPVYLKDELIIKTGSNVEKGVAYTDCDKNVIPTIFFKKVFYRKANKKQLTNILKHELTHAWLCRQQLMSVGHGAMFQKKFKQVGGFGN
jgi:hypothetical protein